MKLKLLEFPNMKYKEILKGDDPIFIVLKKQEVDIIKYVSEGFGFFKKGYELIVNKIIYG